MDVLHNLALGFQEALTVQNLLFCAMGCTVGTLVGLLPGRRSNPIAIGRAFAVPRLSSKPYGNEREPCSSAVGQMFLDGRKGGRGPGSLKKSITIQNIFRWRGLYAPGHDPTRGNHCCVYRLSHCVEKPASRK
jgi:hypothetical protein